MDPVALTVIFKGVAMLGIILVGGLAVNYGFRLYRDGAGSGKDHYAVEIGPVKATAHSVGSVVMATGFLWAWAAVAISPNLDKRGDNIRVYSFDTPAGAITSPELVARVSKHNPPSLQNPEELKGLLRNAWAAAETKQGGSIVSLAGMPASIDFGTLEAAKDPSGNVQLTAAVKAGAQTGEISFEAHASDGKLIFVPAKAD
ncbi:hypothetical protein ACFPN1_16145 [Lysobacter yangpyeongensis]|uniref:Uncharacterized protein n=1 Tax=Lysobacter yangpyeongensis TaxID=346182 RepID=A0ABW0SSR4_9GAMM